MLLIRLEGQEGRIISFVRAFNIAEWNEQTFEHIVSAIKLIFLLFLDIPNLSSCQLSPKDRVINKYINKKEEFGNDVKTWVYLKDAGIHWYPGSARPIAEFLEALSDLLCNPLYFPVSKGF